VSARVSLIVLAFPCLLATPLLAQSANLSVTQLDSPDPVAAGATLTYDLTVSNKGPDDALVAVLDDPLPAETTFLSVSAPAGWICSSPLVGTNGTVSCSAPNFSPGSAAFSVTVTVLAATPVGTVITNTATVDSATGDPSDSDNSASAQTTVAPSSATAVSITVGDLPDPVDSGSDLDYTLTANSNAPRDTEAATVSDTLPSGTTFVSLGAPAGWSCSTPTVGAAGAIACTVAPFPQGDAVFTLVVHVAPSVAGGTLLTNFATLLVEDGGRTGSANGSATTLVLSPASLTATKTVSNPTPPGSSVTYSIELRNDGTHTQGDNPGPELTDTLPPELTLTGASATAGTVATAGNTVTWNGALAAGATVTLTVNAAISSGAAGMVITNQASLAYDADGNGTNEAAGVSDDPATTAPDDGTAFTAAAAPVVSVPTLDAWGLLGAAIALAAAGWRRTRRGSAR
jgi:uncharacterized repeat protein (TIGR01451 family)